MLKEWEDSPVKNVTSPLVPHVLLEMLSIPEKPPSPMASRLVTRKETEVPKVEERKSETGPCLKAPISADSEDEDAPFTKRCKILRKRRDSTWRVVRDLNTNRRLYRSASLGNSAAQTEEDTFFVIKREPLDIPAQDTAPLEPFSGTLVSILTVENSQIVHSEDYQDHPKFAPPTPESSAPSYRCANCDKMISSASWPVHYAYHSGLTYRIGIDPELNLADETTAVQIVTHFMKQCRLLQVSCERCGTSKKSARGLVSHRVACGLTPEQIVASKSVAAKVNQRTTKKSSKFSHTFNKALVAKLCEHFAEFQRDEPSCWQRIALEMKDVDGVELQRWQTLRLYFKQSLVLKLKKKDFSDDPEFIDRLQYPYLKRVYSMTISFFTKEPAKVVNQKDNIDDNALFIKSAIDGTYDPAVVAAYKRRGGKGTRIYVNINVNDPRYRLSADQRELLMQIEQSRKRKANKRGCQIKAGTWYETASSSPGVTIENVASPVAQGSNGSVRGLLDEESLEINTQQYDQMMKDSLDPEIPSHPKRRCFTVDSNVDSEEDDVLEVLSESGTITHGDSKHDSGSEPEFIFIDPRDILNANDSINASRDPLQQSVLQQVDSSQLSVSDGVADGERDSTTSEPMFTPSSGESAKTTADQTVEPENSQPTLPNNPDTVRSPCDVASANTESIPTAGADRKIPEGSSSVEQGSVLRREDLAAKSQPKAVSIQSTVVKEKPSDSIPENMKKVPPAFAVDEPRASPSITIVTVVNAVRPVGGPAVFQSGRDSPSSPVEVAFAVSGDFSTVDRVGSGRMAQSASSADTVHVAQSSVEPATSNPKIVEKNAYEDPPVPSKVLERSSNDVENGSTSRPTVVKEEPSDDYHIPDNWKRLMAILDSDSDSELKDKCPRTAADQTAEPEKTAPEHPQESVDESQPSPPNEPKTVWTSCDSERVEQSSVEIASANTESIPTAGADRKIPEGSSSVEQGSALRRVDLVAKSQPKAVSIQSTVVKEKPSYSIPENMKKVPPVFAADEPRTSHSITIVTDVNAVRPVDGPAAFQSGRDSPSSSVEVAVAVSGDINASTVDLVGCGRMAQSASSADAVHVAQSSVEPATSNAKIVKAYQDPPVPTKVLERSRNDVENGSTSRPTVVKEEPSDDYRIPDNWKSLMATLDSDSDSESRDECPGTTTNQTAESEKTAPEHPQESVVESQPPPPNEPKTVRTSCGAERVEQGSVEIPPANTEGADRTSIVEDRHKVPEPSSSVKNGSTSRSTVLEEEPLDDSGFRIPVNLENLMALIEADSEDESELPTFADLVNSGRKAQSDAAHVGRPSVESNAAVEKVADSGIDTGTGRPVALHCGSGRKESDAVIQDPAVPNASLAGNNSLQSSNSGHESPQISKTSATASAAVIEDQIVPRGDSIEVPSVPSVNIGPGPTLTPIQPHRWVAHHRTLEPVIRSHAALYGTLQQQWPQLFQRPTSTLNVVSVLNSLNTISAAIGATLFNGLKADIVRALELRAAIDALAIRIAYGLTQQELYSLQQARSTNPRRSPLERNWEVVVRSTEDGVPIPKRIKISESAGSSSYSLQIDSPVRICLSDSEDSPSLLLPARKKRGYRVRQNERRNP